MPIIQNKYITQDEPLQYTYKQKQTNHKKDPQKHQSTNKQHKQRMEKIVKSSEWSRLPSDIWKINDDHDCESNTYKSNSPPIQPKNTIQTNMNPVSQSATTDQRVKTSTLSKHQQGEDQNLPTQAEKENKEITNFQPYDFIQTLHMWDPDEVHQVYVCSTSLQPRFKAPKNSIPHYIADIGGIDLLSMQDGGSTANLIEEDQLDDIPNKTRIPVQAKITDYAQNEQTTTSAYIIPVKVPTIDDKGNTVYETTEELFYPVKKLNSPCLLGRPIINSLSINDYKGLLTIKDRKIPTVNQPDLQYEQVSTVTLKHQTTILPETQLTFKLQPNHAVQLENNCQYMIVEHPACRQSHNSIFKNHWEFLNTVQRPGPNNTIIISLRNKSPYTRITIPHHFPIGYIYKVNQQDIISQQEEINLIINNATEQKPTTPESADGNNHNKQPESQTSTTITSTNQNAKVENNLNKHFSIPKYKTKDDVPDKLPNMSPSIFSETSIPVDQPIASSHCYSCGLKPKGDKLPKWAESIMIGKGANEEIKQALIHLIKHYSSAFYDYQFELGHCTCCLLYTSDAADE